MVTGSDACTTNDGAGPSNAFAGLANTILGTSSKDQERLKEVCPYSHQLLISRSKASSSSEAMRHVDTAAEGLDKFNGFLTDLAAFL